MKYISPILILICSFFILTYVHSQQEPTVYAEAQGQANLRAVPDVPRTKVGDSTTGIRYPVIGRSEFYPWVLVADRDTLQPLGWVFKDLVTLYGDIFTVPISEEIVDPSAPPPSIESQATTAPGQASTPATTITLTPTATLAAAVRGTVEGEVNIRYGPGIDFPRVWVAPPGTQFEITSYHTQFPWVQIRIPENNSLGWIANDLITIEGNIYSLPPITQTTFDLPPLTATPPTVNQSTLLEEEVPLSQSFITLGNQIWDMILSRGFDPLTSKFGTMFLMNPKTGEALTFGNEYAFSGTSINKIGILAALYKSLDAPPNASLATDIANMMICSENVATNRVLGVIGSGDELTGATLVTRFFRDLGLKNSFLTAPYKIPGREIDTSRPIEYPKTEIDQTKAKPELTNQLTAEDMGWLLASIYQCAYDGSGALIDTFGDAFEPRECRQMLHVMKNNNVDALLKSGVPADTPVAHKHGWIEDTHANASIFFTEGGDYIMVMILHQPEWLDYSESLPVMADASRMVYNYFNPDDPQLENREAFIPDANSCNFANTPLILDLRQPVWDE
ncbi:hypothetical protein MASR2M15_23630 [Anaerolineales bacterium]